MQLFKPKHSDHLDHPPTETIDANEGSDSAKADLFSQDEIVKVIQGIEGFNNLSESEITQLIDQLEIAVYDDGDVVIEQGKPGYSMHILLRGKVKVVFVDEKGQNHLLDRLKKGDIFGEMAILTGKPRSANVIAVNKVTTCVIDKKTLQELIGYHPDIARFITQIIRERIDQDHAMAIGPYILKDEIGHGSIALIYKGQCNLGRDIAVKMLRHNIAYRKKFRKIFFEEAKIIAQLRHPNIIRLYGIEEAYGTIFIIMEYLNGLDLKTYLRIRKQISCLEALQILHQIAEALRYAHSHGVIHRDVKPSNCIVTQEFGELKVTLTDFGLAREQELIEGEKNRRIAGTPLYISPEAAQSRDVDFRADIYALGVIAYELLMGQVPFLAPSVKELLRKHIHQEPPVIDLNLPAGLRKFISKALVKDPQHRISCWNEILSLLSLHENVRELEYTALSRISKFSHAGTSRLQLIKQSFKEGEKLIDGTIVGHILIKAGQGQRLTEEIEENSYAILRKCQLSDADIEKQLSIFKNTIESGDDRMLLMLLGISSDKPQPFMKLSDLLIEVNEESDFFKFLQNGMGYYTLNTDYAFSVPLLGTIRQVGFEKPVSYACMPLTAHMFSWISDLQGTVSTVPQINKGMQMVGCIQIFQHAEEYNDNCFLEKLRALQFLISHALRVASLQGEFTSMRFSGEPADQSRMNHPIPQSPSGEKPSPVWCAGQIFQRNPQKRFGDDYFDSQMLKILMELDGKRNLKAIANAVYVYWDTLEKAMDRLNHLQTIKPADEDGMIMGPGLVDYLKKELSIAMGPVAKVFFEESLAEMGLDTNKLSNKQLNELIEFIIGLIPRKEKKESFRQRVTQELKKYQ